MRSPGNILKDLRKRRHLSQKMLAGTVGVSLSIVQKWEANAATPNSANFNALAAALQLPVAELDAELHGQARPPVSPLQGPEPVPGLSSVVRWFVELGGRERYLVVRTLQGLARPPAANEEERVVEEELDGSAPGPAETRPHPRPKAG